MTSDQWLTSDDPWEMLHAMCNWPSDGAGCHPLMTDRKLRLFACAVERIAWRTIRLSGMTDEYIEEAPIAISLLERMADGENVEDAIRPLVWAGWHIFIKDAKIAARWAVEMEEVDNEQKANILREIIGNPIQPVILPLEEVAVPVEAKHVVHPFAHVAAKQGALFRKVKRCPWRTAQVMELATTAYQEIVDGIIDPQRLLVLADALEEAGVPSEEDRVIKVRCRGEVQGHGNKGLGYYKYWRCRSCGNKCTIAPQEADGRCHIMVSVTERHPHQLLAHLRSKGPHYRGCWVIDTLLEKN